MGVDQRIPVFAHDQFYVAMSRVRSIQGLGVLKPVQSESGRVLHIVYREVLRALQDQGIYHRNENIGPDYYRSIDLIQLKVCLILN